MESFKLEKIKEWLSKRGFPFTGIFIHPRQENIIIFYSSDNLSSKAKKGVTSLRQISYLRKYMNIEFDMDANFIQTQSSNQNEMENVVNLLIEQKFPELISKFSISFPSPGTINIWLESKIPMEILPAIFIQQLETYINPHLLPFGYKINKIQGTINSANFPNNISILKQLKISQPCTPEELNQVLLGSGFDLPDPLWLSKQLDRLRKDKFVARSKSNHYALTAEGLKSVPETRRRNGSDILRILALGTRRWI